MKTRLQHIWLALSLLPLLAVSPPLRSALVEARQFCQSLPQRLKGPLLEALARLTPTAPADSAPAENTLRRLADLAALLDRQSPLGLCLRRSLTRYYFLRRSGVPVVLQFGARFVSGKPDREVTGHAWLTLQGQPYYERTENYQGFTVMFSFPPNAV